MMISPYISVRDRADKVMIVSFSVLHFIVGVAILAEWLPNAPTLEETLISTALTAWGLLLTLGTPVLLLGRFINMYRLEAAGCFATATAYAVYSTALLFNNFEDGVVVALFFSAFTISYGYRGFALSRLANKGLKVGWNYDGDPIP